MHVQTSMLAMREPHFLDLVRTMAGADLLPAIYFMFSRKRCNESATRVHQALVTRAERSSILAELNALRAVQPEAIPKSLVEPLLRGVASHHAGLLPGALLVLHCSSALGALVLNVLGRP